jgi:hypothetical protein
VLTQKPVKIQRISGNPIIHPALEPGPGDNINGPSLIEAPDWIDNAPGRYLLYFAHHNGGYIRLAYSDDLDGEWQIYRNGVLPLADSHFKGHIASPDVHVDHAQRRIRMYFHGSDEPTDADVPQHTRVALSSDGIHFTAQPEILGNSYLRAFEHDNYTYAIAMPGVIYRSQDGLTNFETGPTLFTEHMRHCAVHKHNNTLSVFYTNAGDCPESILLSSIDLTDDWMRWTHTTPLHVASPEQHYEGSDMPLVPSVRGMASEPVNELRDPAIFEQHGQLWLLYAVAGEQGIALARLTE